MLEDMAKGPLGVVLIVVAWFTYYACKFVLGFIISDPIDRASLSLLASIVVTAIILVSVMGDDKEMSD